MIGGFDRRPGPGQSGPERVSGIGGAVAPAGRALCCRTRPVGGGANAEHNGWSVSSARPPPTAPPSGDADREYKKEQG